MNGDQHQLTAASPSTDNTGDQGRPACNRADSGPHISNEPIDGCSNSDGYGYKWGMSVSLSDGDLWKYQFNPEGGDASTLLSPDCSQSGFVVDQLTSVTRPPQHDLLLPDVGDRTKTEEISITKSITEAGCATDPGDLLPEPHNLPLRVRSPKPLTELATSIVSESSALPLSVCLTDPGTISTAVIDPSHPVLVRQSSLDHIPGIGSPSINTDTCTGGLDYICLPSGQIAAIIVDSGTAETDNIPDMSEDSAPNNDPLVLATSYVTSSTETVEKTKAIDCPPESLLVITSDSSQIPNVSVLTDTLVGQVPVVPVVTMALNPPVVSIVDKFPDLVAGMEASSPVEFEEMRFTAPSASVVENQMMPLIENQELKVIPESELHKDLSPIESQLVQNSLPRRHSVDSNIGRGRTPTFVRTYREVKWKRVNKSAKSLPTHPEEENDGSVTVDDQYVNGKHIIRQRVPIFMANGSNPPNMMGRRYSAGDLVQVTGSGQQRAPLGKCLVIRDSTSSRFSTSSGSFDSTTPTSSTEDVRWSVSSNGSRKSDGDEDEDEDFDLVDDEEEDVDDDGEDDEDGEEDDESYEDGDDADTIHPSQSISPTQQPSAVPVFTLSHHPKKVSNLHRLALHQSLHKKAFENPNAILPPGANIVSQTLPADNSSSTATIGLIHSHSSAFDPVVPGSHTHSQSSSPTDTQPATLSDNSIENLPTVSRWMAPINVKGTIPVNLSDATPTSVETISVPSKNGKQPLCFQKLNYSKGGNVRSVKWVAPQEIASRKQSKWRTARTSLHKKDVEKSSPGNSSTVSSEGSDTSSQNSDNSEGMINSSPESENSATQDDTSAIEESETSPTEVDENAHGETRVSRFLVQRVENDKQVDSAESTEPSTKNTDGAFKVNRFSVQPVEDVKQTDADENAQLSPQKAEGTFKVNRFSVQPVEDVAENSNLLSNNAQETFKVNRFSVQPVQDVKDTDTAENAQLSSNAEGTFKVNRFSVQPVEDVTTSPIPSPGQMASQSKASQTQNTKTLSPLPLKPILKSPPSSLLSPLQGGRFSFEPIKEDTEMQSQTSTESGLTEGAHLTELSPQGARIKRSLVRSISEPGGPGTPLSPASAEFYGRKSPARSISPSVRFQSAVKVNRFFVEPVPGDKSFLEIQSEESCRSVRGLRSLLEQETGQRVFARDLSLALKQINQKEKSEILTPPPPPPPHSPAVMPECAIKVNRFFVKPVPDDRSPASPPVSCTSSDESKPHNSLKIATDVQKSNPSSVDGTSNAVKINRFLVSPADDKLTASQGPIGPDHPKKISSETTQDIKGSEDDSDSKSVPTSRNQNVMKVNRFSVQPVTTYSLPNTDTTVKPENNLAKPAKDVIASEVNLGVENNGVQVNRFSIQPVTDHSFQEQNPGTTEQSECIPPKADQEIDVSKSKPVTVSESDNVLKVNRFLVQPVASESSSVSSPADKTPSHYIPSESRQDLESLKATIGNAIPPLVLINDTEVAFSSDTSSQTTHTTNSNEVSAGQCSNNYPQLSESPSASVENGIKVNRFLVEPVAGDTLLNSEPASEHDRKEDRLSTTNDTVTNQVKIDRFVVKPVSNEAVITDSISSPPSTSQGLSEIPKSSFTSTGDSLHANEAVSQFPDQSSQSNTINLSDTSLHSALPDTPAKENVNPCLSSVHTPIVPNRSPSGPQLSSEQHLSPSLTGILTIALSNTPLVTPQETTPSSSSVSNRSSSPLSIRGGNCLLGVDNDKKKPLPSKDKYTPKLKDSADARKDKPSTDETVLTLILQSIAGDKKGSLIEKGGGSTVAIDNKIEQAMDLVKRHLMYAVREEVEILKQQIGEMMERIGQLEYENTVLRSEAMPETLNKLQIPRVAQTPAAGVTGQQASMVVVAQTPQGQQPTSQLPSVTQAAGQIPQQPQQPPQQPPQQQQQQQQQQTQQTPTSQTGQQPST